MGLYASSVRADEDQPARRSESNLQVMEKLVEAAGKEIAANLTHAHGDSITLRCSAGDDRWIIQNGLTASLKASGFQVFTTNDSLSRPRILADIHPVNFTVHYDEMFRDGFLGSKKTRRTVSVELACLLTNPLTGEVFYSGSPKGESTDTVSVESLPALESPDLKSTHGEVPSETFLDRIIEPVVLIGATGVAVYLFFHIRS